MLEFLKRLLGKTVPSQEKLRGDNPIRSTDQGLAPAPLPEQTRTPQMNDAAGAYNPMAGYPNAYCSLAKTGRGKTRPEVFEPALQQFSRAFRLGDPSFQSAEDRHLWIKARSQVAHHLLKRISESRWKHHLVLRGSFLLKAWLGNAAREPGDIDWVFRPADVEINNALSGKLFEELIRFASMQPQVGSATIDAAEITIDDIWTYERASGRRIVFPYTVQGLPPGEVQMDVVFGEELFTEAISTPVPTLEGDNLIVMGASREVSLAWKLLWLQTDMYPQGKDLYDATLLAEQTRLARELFYQVLRSGDVLPTIELEPDFPMKWNVDWENFKLEYPWVEGEAEDWQSRLTAALAPMFAD